MEHEGRTRSGDEGAGTDVNVSKAISPGKAGMYCGGSGKAVGRSGRRRVAGEATAG